MSEFMWVKLCSGKRVRDPISQHILIADKAYKVKRNQFWLRRLDSQDVELCDDPEAAPKLVAESETEVKSSKKKKEKLGE